MAEIFLARNVGPGGFEKKLIIKRIRPGLEDNPQWVDMFTEEAKIAATLDHPNIVHVYDFGIAEEQYFIAMEYVSGVDLAKILKAQHQMQMRMPPDLAIYITNEILKALRYAHDRTDYEGSPTPVIHRDVSPPNVLISHSGNVKLADFGIAKALHRGEMDLTRPGIFKGKLHYVAPEQLKAKRVDPRADLFSTGILLYSLLTNARPFQGKTREGLLNEIEEGGFRGLDENFQRIPGGLQLTIRKSLQALPEKRFQTAQQFGNHLTQNWSGSPSVDFPHRLSSYVALLFSDQSFTISDPSIDSSMDTEPEIDAQTTHAQFQVSQESGLSETDKSLSGETPAPARVLPPPKSPSFDSPDANRRPKKWVFLLFALLFGAGVYFFAGDPIIIKEQEDSSPPPPLATAKPNVTPIPTSPPTATPVSPTPSPTRRPEKKVRTSSRKRPSPPKPAGFGTLTVFLPKGPFATVYVDGKKIGNTPILKHKISAGTRRLTFRNQKLNLQREMTLQVNKGQAIVLKKVWKP